MGILYKEVVEYKYQRNIKPILAIILLLLIANTFFLLSSYRRAVEGLAYVSYALIPIALITAFVLNLKSSIRYRYGIIDNELIIERFNKKKRKVTLNLNTKYICSIERFNSDKKMDRVDEEYNFICSGKKKEVYCCTFKRNGRLCRFYFEPSQELIKKLNMLMARRTAA
jgi:hypothetical protein